MEDYLQMVSAEQKEYAEAVSYTHLPDIRRHNMQHEELFCCHSAEWVEEVRKAVEGDR